MVAHPDNHVHCIDGDDPDLASSPVEGSGLHRLGSPFGASPSGMRSRTLGQVHRDLSHIHPTMKLAVFQCLHVL